MAFISNKPKFLSSESAELNFCQGVRRFLLVFYSMPFILYGFSHCFIVLNQFCFFHELNKDLAVLYYFLVQTALVGKRCMSRVKTSSFLMEHILI